MAGLLSDVRGGTLDARRRAGCLLFSGWLLYLIGANWADIWRPGEGFRAMDIQLQRENCMGRTPYGGMAREKLSGCFDTSLVAKGSLGRLNMTWLKSVLLRDQLFYA